MIGVYEIVNTYNGKIYIGSTSNFKVRKDAHLNSLRNNKHYNKSLQEDFNKFGEDSFQVRIIRECKYKELSKYESLYAHKNNCFNKEGYNIIELPKNSNISKTAIQRYIDKLLGALQKAKHHDVFDVGLIMEFLGLSEYGDFKVIVDHISTEDIQRHETNIRLESGIYKTITKIDYSEATMDKMRESINRM